MEMAVGGGNGGGGGLPLKGPLCMFTWLCLSHRVSLCTAVI